MKWKRKEKGPSLWGKLARKRVRFDRYQGKFLRVWNPDGGLVRRGGKCSCRTGTIEGKCPPNLNCDNGEKGVVPCGK